MLGARTGAQASRYRTLVRAGSPFDHPYGSSHVILLYENEYRTTFSRRLTLREQIRGDYGSSFKTSATIVITLDTDAGTLRFSSWKDSNTSGSFSLDPVSQGLFSPKNRDMWLVLWKIGVLRLKVFHLMPGFSLLWVSTSETTG